MKSCVLLENVDRRREVKGSPLFVDYSHCSCVRDPKRRPVLSILLVTISVAKLARTATSPALKVCRMSVRKRKVVAKVSEVVGR